MGERVSKSVKTKEGFWKEGGGGMNGEKVADRCGNEVIGNEFWF